MQLEPRAGHLVDGAHDCERGGRTRIYGASATLAAIAISSQGQHRIRGQVPYEPTEPRVVKGCGGQQLVQAGEPEVGPLEAAIRRLEDREDLFESVVSESAQLERMPRCRRVGARAYPRHQTQKDGREGRRHGHQRRARRASATWGADAMTEGVGGGCGRRSSKGAAHSRCHTKGAALTGSGCGGRRRAKS